ncbi:hypothetical protein Vafri_21028 [Volvox africanus]|uniref:RNA helicase n=1 Tax=Volvox africanus TaxID=51714 RepID=A0A8J4BUX6_9CHLO|nr:hypothetical protein Vafri_21028 [Volvox africanus]
MDPRPASTNEEAVNVFIKNFYARNSDAGPGINFYKFKTSCSVFTNSPYAFIRAWFRERPQTYTVLGQLVVPHGIAAELPTATVSATAAPAAIPAIVMAALTKPSPGLSVSLYCSICGIRCTSEDNMRDHIRGARHAKAVLAAKPQQLIKMLQDFGEGHVARLCNHCEVCGRWFTNPDLLRVHAGSAAHRARIYWALLRPKLKQQGATCRIPCSSTAQQVHLTPLPRPLPAVAPNTTARHQITITNQGPGPVQLRSVFILNPVTDGSMRLEGSCGITDPRVRTDVWIKPFAFREVTLVLEPKWLGLMRNLIIFDLAPSGPVAEAVAASCCPPDMPAPSPPEGDEAEDEQQKKKRSMNLEPVNFDVVDGIPPPGYKDSVETAVKMRSLTVPPQLRSLVQEKDEEKLRQLVPPRRHVAGLGQAEYAKRLQQLLWLEELQHEIDIRWYDMKEVTLDKVGQTYLLELKVPGLAENRPSVLKGDRLLVAHHNSTSGREYAGYVHVVMKEQVRMRFADSFLNNEWIAGRRFDVRFTVNRSVFNLMQNALRRAAKPSNLSPSLVLPGIRPSTPPVGLPLREPPGGDTYPGASGGPLVWQHTNLNTEQRLAVREVLRGAYAPLPYLIFGPPGTGKTSTLVEAAKQLLLTQPSSRLLLVAPSNSAADLLIQSLAATSGAAATRTMSRHLGPGSCNMMRMCAYSRPLDSLPRDLKEQAEEHGLRPLRGAAKGHVAAVNWDSEQQAFLVPSLEMLMDPRLRVVVATCATAARLVHAGVPGGRFSHILVDEAGHAEEPLLMCALAGLTGAKCDVRVVMAGDPKQLGPIILSAFAKRYGGLDVSLMEYLMDASDGPYVRQIDNPQQPSSAPVLGSYPSAYITKLLQNYRSHPDILRVSNAAFYDNELIPAANADIVNGMLQWEELPNPRVPMMMHHIVGKDVQEANSPSWQNDLEVRQVKAYVDKLLQKRRGGRVRADEIGIITPYNKQVQRIRAVLGLLSDQIKVGSVEEFQGQERRIIIISTVRSSDEYLEFDTRYRLGFLSNPKRFNVAVTRAKALLVVVGNAQILAGDKNWRALLCFLRSSGAIVGQPLSLKVADLLDRPPTAKTQEEEEEEGEQAGGQAGGRRSCPGGPADAAPIDALASLLGKLVLGPEVKPPSAEDHAAIMSGGAHVEGGEMRRFD